MHAPRGYRSLEKCTATERCKDMHKYLVSWLQILSCEYSYNIKGWCSFCLRSDHRFRVALFTSGCCCCCKAQHSAVERGNIVLNVAFVFSYHDPLYSRLTASQQKLRQRKQGRYMRYWIFKVHTLAVLSSCGETTSSFSLMPFLKKRKRKKKPVIFAALSELLL